MFDWLYNALGSMLSWFSSIMGGSYALALLLYALLFKILFLFFSIKQQKNQIAMAKLTPKIELIKAKYRGSTSQAAMRKQQEEIMALQQKEGYSPLSGCLPLLLQLPIIVLLYNVIRNPLSYLAKLEESVIRAVYGVVNNISGAELEAVSFKNIDQIILAGDIKKFVSTQPAGDVMLFNAGLEDLSVIPSFELWGLNLAEKPTLLSWLVLIPILAALFQWLSMFITRKLTGNNQIAPAADDAAANMQSSMKMMDLMMPAMTIFFTFSFSAMMGLYWIYQSIIGIIQTVILAKLMPVPKFSEEDIKNIEKARKAAEKTQKNIIKGQPKYKSLHYIDEDDYEDLPEVKSSTPKENKPLNQDKPEIKD